MTTQIKRRTMLAGIGLAGIGALGAGVMGSGHAAEGQSAGVSQAKRSWRDMVRMQMSTAPGDVVWWYTGRIYAQVGEQSPQHLYNLEGTEIYWVRELDDGSFSVSSRTLTFFRDKLTGEMIREYVNPFTGKTNQVSANRLGGKDTNNFTAAGWTSTYGSDPARQREPWQIDWHRSGDLEWLTSSRFTKRPPQPLMESATVFCSTDALSNPEIHSLPSHFTSSYLSPWQRWMEMGDQEGHLLWHSSGRKLNSLDEIPAEYRQRVDSEYGGVLTASPDSWG
ncbi:MAG TPA: DUF1838 family protein [Xanthomonadales bacterium]|nr:DUF1838 family protein [Xanthomonadales bacterium]